MNTANACSSIAPGGHGSKAEALDSLSIITLNDFDVDHPAGTSINDILDYGGSRYNPWNENSIPLVDFLTERKGKLLETEDMISKLRFPWNCQQEKHTKWKVCLFI